MTLQRVRKSIEFLRKKAKLDLHLANVKLVTDGHRIFEICKDDGEVLEALREGQMVFFLAIDDIARTVDTKVSQYLYDREEFVTALRQVESKLASQRPQEEQRLRSVR